MPSLLLGEPFEIRQLLGARSDTAAFVTGLSENDYSLRSCASQFKIMSTI